MHVLAGHSFPDATGAAFALMAWARHRCLQLYLIRAQAWRARALLFSLGLFLLIYALLEKWLLTKNKNFAFWSKRFLTLFQNLAVSLGSAFLFHLLFWKVLILNSFAVNLCLFSTFFSNSTVPVSIFLSNGHVEILQFLYCNSFE